MKFVFSLIFLLGFFSVNAQIIKKTEDKAKKKSTDRVDKKIDEGLDKSLDAIEGLFSKKKKDKGNSSEEMEMPDQNNNQDPYDASQMNALMGMMNTTEIERTYEFTNNFRMKAETFEKGKLQSTVDMTMYLSDADSYMGMEIHGEDGKYIDFMVLDMANNEMLTLMNTDGQKMGMIISTEQADNSPETQETITDVSFRKTGNSEKISGFSCVEYQVIYEDQDENEQFFWMTTETDSDWIKSMANMSALGPKAPVDYQMPQNYPEGSVIRINSVSKDKSEENVITIVELNNNSEHEVSTAGYGFIQMPSQPGY